MSRRPTTPKRMVEKSRHLPTRRSEQVYGEFYVWGMPPQKRKHETLSQAAESMTSLCYRSIATYINEDKLQGLQSFLENKQVQVDDRDENGATALMLAATKGRIAFVCELLAHSASPNAEDDDGWSPLLCAAKEGHADVCHELLEHGANIEHRDMGGWTALMWATYKGRADVVHLLLDRGADVSAHGNFHISSLLWAAGRGHTSIVQALVGHGAKVNVGDKYGTTALVWASRKGYVEIVDCLLHAGANVDTAGMYSWTALLVATQGNHIDVVNLLLEYKPNVNALDKDGCSALTIACKEGYYEIASALMNFGAYINVQDRVGDTNLIHAIKGGHRGVVEALLKKYADVDICGKDRKTALYIAVEKGNVPIVKMLLNANPDLEVATKDGDTPMLKAVRSRNSEIVQLLLDKKAKVSATDKKGDTALHIAMRARSKGIVEILLRNPKHSQLLYRPNRAGETPYNIDAAHQKTILGQIFGARRLNTNEDNENMLGYDLYSSALADILSEPLLSMPITVGLYAKWGSGKSFLLNKLREEMKNFARQWVDPSFQFSSLLFLVVLHIAVIAGTLIGVAILNWTVGLIIVAFIVIFTYVFLALIWFASKRYDWDWPYNFSIKLTRKLNNLKLVLQIVFCHPPGVSESNAASVQPIRFYFTDQARVSSTVAGESCAVQLCGSLYDAIERDYGTMATRLYRAFKPKPSKSSNWKWRKVCCLPNILIFEITLICFLTVTCALTVFLIRSNYKNDIFTDLERLTLNIVMIAAALPLGIVTIANFYTWNKMFLALIFSQRKHLQRTISKMDSVKAEGFLQGLKDEVYLMKNMVKCLDSLSSQQTRLVVIVDGLDSCEQDKVLLVLDAVHLLFSDANSPFIVILAIDPHVIAKAVEINSRRLFSESNIDGHSYLSNMVHLPFYLQNSGLRKVKLAQQTSQSHRKAPATTSGFDIEDNLNFAGNNLLGRSLSSRRLSTESALMSSTEKLKFGNARKGSRKLKLSESVASSIGSNLNKIGGAQDLTKMLLTDDYFSDVNPKSMRRLMNVVYVTGRLMKAFQIDFNWYRLASWINITEQWPFRTSWIIYHYDTYEDNLEDNTSLKSIYEKIRPFIPTLKVIEPLLELDRDERKFDIFLSFHRSSLLISDLKIFLPFTINLDPYLKKVIKEEAPGLDDDDTGLNMSRNSFLGSASLPPNYNWVNSATGTEWNNSPPGAINSIRRSKLLSSRMTPPPSAAVVYPGPAVSAMGWPQWGDPLMAATTQQYGFRPVTDLSSEMLENKLSTLSVDGVCRLLDNIGENNPLSLSTYKKVIQENNVSGRVLLHCDLDELKKLLKMNFGDWEMFRMLIVSMRSYEMTSVLKQNETKLYSSKSSQPVYIRERKASVTKMDKESGSKSQIDGSVNKSKQNIIEKQVTLEDQMICGALQTLNEEACEDVIEETEDVPYSDNIPRTSIIPPSPENAVSDVLIGETDYVILQSSPIGHVSWHPISISVCGNTESLSDTVSLTNSQPPSPVERQLATHSFVKVEKIFNRSEKSLQRPSSLYLFNDDSKEGGSTTAGHKVRSKSIDSGGSSGSTSHQVVERKSSFGKTQYKFKNRMFLSSDPGFKNNLENAPFVNSSTATIVMTSNKQSSSVELSNSSEDMSCLIRTDKHEEAEVPLLNSDEDNRHVSIIALGNKHSRSCGHLSSMYDSLKNLMKDNNSDTQPRTEV